MMHSRFRRMLGGCLLTVLCHTCLAAAPALADLQDYVDKKDDSFAWKLKEKKDLKDGGVVYDLYLMSQTWQDIKWEHQLQVYLPKDLKPNGTILLYNTGGKAQERTILVGMEFARRSQTPCAFLYDIPNQPLLDGRKEDALIAETFLRYVKTKDGSWPLLFPMVKSLVRAMDALQEFSQKEWSQKTEKFVVAGASKRGWTTWLTGASDKRVKAIAPLVIDTLNMREQMKHQLDSFGKYSEMIHDYTEAKLVPIPDTPEAEKLWKMVDPYLYCDKLTMPKLIINGNNDPYWTADALNLYWDGLQGDKYVLYVPNAGHDLRVQGEKDPLKALERAVNGLSAFVRCQSTGKSMPKLSWKHSEDGDKLKVTVETSPAPKAARLWVATAPTRDFRKAEWKEQQATVEKGTVKGEVSKPKEGYLIYYADLDYEVDGLLYHLCTQVKVAGTLKK